jgi:hypothetical protein
MRSGKLAVMSDSEDVKSPDGLEYTKDGILKTPQLDGPWGSFSYGLAFFSPFLVLWDKWKSPVPAGLLRTTTLVQIALKQHFLSENQVDNAVFLFTCLLLAIVCAFVLFFKKNAAKYSSQSPPPIPLRELWPKQIRLMILFGGTGLIGAPIGLAVSRSLFAPLCLFYLGFCFFADGLARGSLYAYFYFKYWRL